MSGAVDGSAAAGSVLNAVGHQAGLGAWTGDTGSGTPAAPLIVLDNLSKSYRRG